MPAIKVEDSLFRKLKERENLDILSPQSNAGKTGGETVLCDSSHLDLTDGDVLVNQQKDVVVEVIENIETSYPGSNEKSDLLEMGNQHNPVVAEVMHNKEPSYSQLDADMNMNMIITNNEINSSELSEGNNLEKGNQLCNVKLPLKMKRRGRPRGIRTTVVGLRKKRGK
ncbi:uncharacterized protein LOC126746216 [Anthonomus grandis grandis]|uniref:uncharacterized protein LOC126746216 n=1 Tax=Anthonomus grandis grandis TaxID=2921223 RepID=UPI00216515D1|nr:uncharacterized protein LOC126746216 [Anthonomus grandis grandis]